MVDWADCCCSRSCLTTFLLIIASKNFLMTLRKLMGRYYDGDECSFMFLKTGHILDTFHSLGKDFFFRQQLNNFTKMGDNSGLIFLKQPLGFYLLSVKAWDYLGSDKNITTFVLCERGNLGRGWSLSSKLELEVKIFALSEITPGPFMIAGTNALP